MPKDVPNSVMAWTYSFSVSPSITVNVDVSQHENLTCFVPFQKATEITKVTGGIRDHD